MQATSKMNRAVFLDRDGVLNEAVVRNGRPYPPPTFETFSLLPGVAEAARALHDSGYMLIVATNQPDVATGKQSRQVVDAMHAKLMAELPITEIYACFATDAPDNSDYKPKPGMLLRAARDHGIDLERSFMVGDRWRDVGAGKAAGCRTFFIDYGYDEALRDQPDVIVSSLAEAAGIILGEAHVTTPVILTGAGSFLGAYVLKVLDAKGIDTFALSRQAATVCARLGLSERIRPVEIDLSASSMNWLPPAGGPYSIIHLAFDRMASGSSTDGAETNHRITHNILDLRRNAHIATIVNASSTSVYGKPEGGLVSAETAPRSPSEYGTAKLLAEQLLADSADAGIDSVFSIRLPAVLGAGAHPENWLVRVAQSMQEHAEIAYQSPDFLFNNAVHGAGVGAFFVKLSQVPTPAGDVNFPIGAAPGPTLRDMLERMRDRLESRSTLTVHPATSAPFAIDNSTAERHGYKAEPVENVIDRYLDDLAGNNS